MKGYERILVAVDFECCAELICHRAAELAARYGAHVILLHVVEPMVMDSAYDMLPVISPALDEELVARARAQLGRLAEHSGLAHQAQMVVTGATKAEILRTAAELPADLLVVGSHWRHGIGRLLGSTASGVVQGASCDVLTVHLGDAS